LDIQKSEKKENFGDLYSILRVAKDATAEEIKAAYKKLANKHHPDKKGGDEETFKLVQQAYDVLSDVVKRQNYDDTGIYEGDDAQFVANARAHINSAVSVIISANINNLEYIDIVGTIKGEISKDLQNNANVVAKVNNKIKLLEKGKLRAKAGLIADRFDDSIEQCKATILQVEKNNKVALMAIKIMNLCAYEFDVKPEPVPNGTVIFGGTGGYYR